VGLLRAATQSRTRRRRALDILREAPGRREARSGTPPLPLQNPTTARRFIFFFCS